MQSIKSTETSNKKIVANIGIRKGHETRLGISTSPIPVFPQSFYKASVIQEWVKLIFPVLLLSFFHPYISNYSGAEPGGVIHVGSLVPSRALCAN